MDLVHVPLKYFPSISRVPACASRFCEVIMDYMNTRASVIVALALVLSAAIYSTSNWISRERYKFAVVEYEQNVNGEPLKAKSFVRTDSYTGRVWEYTSQTYFTQGEKPLLVQEWRELRDFNSSNPVPAKQ